MRGSTTQFNGRTFFYNASFKETPIFKAKEVVDGTFEDSKDENSVSGDIVDVSIVERKNDKGETYKQLRITMVDEAMNPPEKYIISFGMNKVSRSLINSLIGAMEKGMKGKVALFVYEKDSIGADGKTYTNKNCGVKFNGEFAPWKRQPAETKNWVEYAKDSKGKDLLVDGKRVASYAEYDKKILEFMPQIKEYFYKETHAAADNIFSELGDIDEKEDKTALDKASELVLPGEKTKEELAAAKKAYDNSDLPF